MYKNDNVKYKRPGGLLYLTWVNQFSVKLTGRVMATFTGLPP